MYCNYSDIEKAIGYEELASCTDVNNGEKVNNAIVEDTITSISAIIDGYLRGRYTLPLIKTHEILKKICIDLVYFELKNGTNAKKPIEGDQAKYDRAYSQLKDIQKGNIILDETNEITKNIAMAVYSQPSAISKARTQYRKMFE